MENITLTLTVNEVNAIIQVLGQLPTSSNAYPLLLKVKQQGEAQVPNQSQPAPNSPTPSISIPQE